MPPKPVSAVKNQPNLFSFFRKNEPSPASTTATPANESTVNEKVESTPAPVAKKEVEKSLSPTNVATAITPVNQSKPTPASTSDHTSTPAKITPTVQALKAVVSEVKNVKKDDDEDELFDSDDEAVNKKRKVLLGTGGVKKDKKQPQQPAKKRKVLEESDDEESAGEDSDSYVNEDDDEDEDEDDDEEDSFIASDDEDDDYVGKKRKSKATAPKKSAVVEKKTNSGSKPPLPPSGNKKTATSYSMTMEPSSGSKSTPFKSTLSSSPSGLTSTPQSAVSKMNIFATPDSHKSEVDSNASNTPRTPSTPSTFQLPEGVVGPGSHDHNSFDFLFPEKRRDANNLPMDHPDYNPRTLKVPTKFHSEQTPAMAQWWTFKAQNMDTVLFFKVGKFYELFHMDADIGFRELDLIYMKGSKAHSGFPEVSYGKFAGILVSKGYRVARVEQTETPDQLKERNDSASKGKKDKVVTRELCSIMTKGTRTYCHLDDLTLLDESFDTSLSTSLLICIKEQAVAMPTPTDGEGEDASEGLLEYGITCIDTVLGHVTLAQFQDDLQCSRLRVLLARMMPTEVLLEANQYSPKTLGVLRLICPKATIEELRGKEMPSDAMDVLKMLYRRQYFGPSPNKPPSTPISSTPAAVEVENPPEHWPEVVRAVIRGLQDQSSALVMLSLGGALWQLTRSLIDYDVFSMGKFAAYVPPDESVAIEKHTKDDSSNAMEVVTEQMETEAETKMPQISAINTQWLPLQHMSSSPVTDVEDTISLADTSNTSTQKHMILDEVALTNLEVLINNYDRTEQGSLWKFLNRCKTMAGKRLLRSWLVQPLYHVADIQTRQSAIEDLLTKASPSLEKMKSILKQIPDIERLLTRIHCNSRKRQVASEPSPSSSSGGGKNSQMVEDHPDVRAVMFEDHIYQTRKIRDFVDLLSGLEKVLNIAEMCQGMEWKARSLQTLLLSDMQASQGGKAKGSFPITTMQTTLKYFRSIFDEAQVKRDGNIKPKPGVNVAYDEAKEEVEHLQQQFTSYLQQMKSETGIHDIKYFGTGKDRYQMEVPMNLCNKVPSHWSTKSQKKTHRRYWTNTLEQQVAALIQAEERVEIAQKDTLRALFAKFHQHYATWARASSNMAIFDALLSLAEISSLPNYNWPSLKSRQQTNMPILQIVNGRHPMLEYTFAQRGEGDYIPNDVFLGGKSEASTNSNDFFPRTLLLTGPNMGGKSTLLRQTCLIVMLAQLGCKVPADSCVMTPVDRIFTRVGASDRILAGQSTFFVELAETTLILRAATTDSLSILDELGRGTATFDGTAIAHAVVEHLVSQIGCRTLFATHYHMLVQDWEMDPRIQLGHMDCMVQSKGTTATTSEEDVVEEVTFLYKLCNGCSPKSYGINVARLAGMPNSVLELALAQSMILEAQINQVPASDAKRAYFEKLQNVLERLVSISHAHTLTLEELVYVASEMWRRYEHLLQSS